MPVKIRLTRMGKKKQPTYRVVVMDSRKPRDGKYLEQIGRYDPRQNPSVIEIDNDRALSWLRQGAQPSDRARKLLEISGAWTQFKVAKGEIHTIGDASAPAVAPTGEIHVVGGPEEVEDDSVPEIVLEADDAVPETQSEPVVETAEAITAEIDTPVPRDVPTEDDSAEPVEGSDA